MKKNYFVISLLILSFGFSQQILKPKYHFGIKLLTKYEYQIIEMYDTYKENLIEIIIQEFDSVGNNINTKIFKTDESLEIIDDKIFDSKGKIVQSENYNLENLINYSSINRYNAEKKYIETLVYDINGKMIFKRFKKFDADKDMVELIHENSIEKLKYDSNGNIVEEIIYHDNKFLNRYSYDNKYDNKDRLVERVRYKNVNRYGEQQRIPIAKIKIKITEF
tara:strand:- start:594 stop:1256 length:663 start_codon:yes stop_codon:yes gene_type:complete